MYLNYPYLYKIWLIVIRSVSLDIYVMILYAYDMVHILYVKTICEMK